MICAKWPWLAGDDREQPVDIRRLSTIAGFDMPSITIYDAPFSSSLALPVQRRSSEAEIRYVHHRHHWMISSSPQFLVAPSPVVGDKHHHAKSLRPAFRFHQRSRIDADPRSERKTGGGASNIV